MKAMLSKAVGGPETLVLEEVADLQPGKGEIVIDVKCASANYPDVLIIQDLYQFKPPRPFSPGGEVAGLVKRVGEGVEMFKVGDRVLAQAAAGGYAEEFKVRQTAAFKIPDAMPFDEASAFMMTYATSYHALKERARIKPGETLLVLGAAGGVGIAAVELAKAMGAVVIAAASSQEKVDFAKASGADIGIVYPTTLDRDAQKKLSDAIKEAGGGGVDVVYDGVGGDYAEPAIRALNWEGRFLVVGFPAGIPKIPLNLTLLKGTQIMGVFWGAAIARDYKGHAQNMKELFALYTEGKIKPRISKHFPLKDAAHAIRELQDRRVTGKVVLNVG